MQTIRTGFIGGRLAAFILRAANPSKASHCTGTAYLTRSKIDALLGEEVWSHITGRTVVDFSCGTGGDAIEMVQRGAARVIGVADRCLFTRDLHHRADVVVSLDGFEHYSDPAGCLRLMHGMLRPGGRLFAAFGPTWFHPSAATASPPFPGRTSCSPRRRCSSGSRSPWTGSRTRTAA